MENEKKKSTPPLAILTISYLTNVRQRQNECHALSAKKNRQRNGKKIEMPFWFIHHGANRMVPKHINHAKMLCKSYAKRVVNLAVHQTTNTTLMTTC